MNNINKIIAYQLLCCILALLPASIFALDTTIDEDTIKVIYSFKFGKFTEWPESKLSNNKSTLGFCILGKNPFSQTSLDAIEGKRLKGKIITIKFFNSGLLSKDALTECFILFVSHSESLRLQNLINTLRNQPILTVSDINGFSANGGMITLIKNKNKNQIHFEINQHAVEQAGLSMSSKLLGLAKIINTAPKVTP